MNCVLFVRIRFNSSVNYNCLFFILDKFLNLSKHYVCNQNGVWSNCSKIVQIWLCVDMKTENCYANLNLKSQFIYLYLYHLKYRYTDFLLKALTILLDSLDLAFLYLPWGFQSSWISVQWTGKRTWQQTSGWPCWRCSWGSSRTHSFCGERNVQKAVKIRVNHFYL